MKPSLSLRYSWLNSEQNEGLLKPFMQSRHLGGCVVPTWGWWAGAVHGQMEWKEACPQLTALILIVSRYHLWSFANPENHCDSWSCQANLLHQISMLPIYHRRLWGKILKTLWPYDPEEWPFSGIRPNELSPGERLLYKRCPESRPWASIFLWRRTLWIMNR